MSGAVDVIDAAAPRGATIWVRLYGFRKGRGLNGLEGEVISYEGLPAETRMMVDEALAARERALSSPRFLIMRLAAASPHTLPPTMPRVPSAAPYRRGSVAAKCGAAALAVPLVVILRAAHTPSPALAPACDRPLA